MLPEKQLQELLGFTGEISKNAGKILLDEQEKVKVVKFKDRQDIATTADLKSESYIISSIQYKYPSHTILSEESGESRKGSEFRWIIDPLDGTKEYKRGIPLYNVSIALEYKEELVISCVYRPSEDSLYSVAKGLGSFLNGNKMQISEIDNLKDAFVYCYLPSHHRNKDRYEFTWKMLGEVGKRVYRLRSLSDENTALCWLAQGSVEAYLNLGNPPKWHDIAAGLLIAKEANAVISDINGNEIENHVESLIAANNKSLHNSLRKIIKP